MKVEELKILVCGHVVIDKIMAGNIGVQSFLYSSRAAVFVFSIHVQYRQGESC